MKKIIELKNVSKVYTLFDNSKEQLLSLFNKEKYGKEFKALDGVNFEAFEGEVIGFIGTNGSGKSTLSNIISGVIPETYGEVNVNGEVSIIAVAAGLNNELTGRENIELKCLMLGFSKQQISNLEPEIIEFSELGTFIDQPVKNYSSGMKSRLGFAISVNVNPDILVIDEALSVGDKAFSEKSFKKMKEFKDEGKTIIFISHSLSQMKMFCDKVLWLEFGRVRLYGKADEVLNKYNNFLKKWKKLSKEEREKYRKDSINSNTPINIDEYIDKLEKRQFISKETSNKDIKEITVSKIVQIRRGKSEIYKDINDIINNKNKISSNPFKNEVYFVNKILKLNKRTFYRISRKKSLLNGDDIGWIDVKNLKTYDFIYVDSDMKYVRLTGENYIYDIPWGVKIQGRYIDLSEHEGELVKVVETWLLNNNVWLKVIYNDKPMWVNQAYVKDVD